jgi:hypothetical protein
MRRRHGSYGFVATFGHNIISEIFRRIYEAEIAGRIEWMFDDGFVWVLVGPNGEQQARNAPRLWMDDALSGDHTTAQSDHASGALDQSQFVMRDWRERGRARTIEDAVRALADAAARHYKASEFARWWREIRGSAAD